MRDADRSVHHIRGLRGVCITRGMRLVRVDEALPVRIEFRVHDGRVVFGSVVVLEPVGLHE